MELKTPRAEVLRGRGREDRKWVRVRRLGRLTQGNESAVLSCLSLFPQTLVGLALTPTLRGEAGGDKVGKVSGPTLSYR